MPQSSGTSDSSEGGSKVADPSLDQLLWSIGIQESGNNYSVVNSIGAVGKYQVMKGNIPSWSKAALGYSITWQQFRDSPALQEKIVRHRMEGYYKKYGFRGAASAWYSGDPTLYNSTRPQSGGPSIKQYVDSVYSRAQKAPANLKTSSSSSASSGGGVDSAKSRSETAESYGFMEALFDSNTELKKLFNQAVDGGWSAEKFQAGLRDTKWWKSHSQQQRDFLTLQFGDPASAKQKLDQAKVKVRQLAESLGIRAGSGIDRKLNAWAMNVAMDGWDDARLRWDMGKYLNFSGDVRQGEGGEAIDKLMELTYNMGVTMSSKWYQDAARAIVRGTGTAQDYEDQIRRQAKTLFPEWSKQLNSGQTVADIASPYFSSMAQILELPPGSINLFDPTIKKALQNKDKVTGANSVKPLWQFENDLRSDSRWKSTQNAQNSMMQIAHQVLADFGVKT